MGLFGLHKKKQEKKTIQPQRDLSHLDENGELPYGWYYANREFTNRIEEEYRFFLNSWVESKRKSPKEEYAALKSFVLYMSDVVSLCRSKGECFDFWRKIHFDDNYLNERSEELKYFEAHFDEIDAEYQKKTYIRSAILDIVKNSPGILQTEVYTRFEQSDRNIVSDILYHLAAENIVEREKSGRSYAIRVKES